MILTPPDPKQCQAIIPNGDFFLIKESPYRTIRCLNSPKWIVTQTGLNQHGQRGSMSVCQYCGDQLKIQLGEHYATFVEI